jgi:hypothetical protein
MAKTKTKTCLCAPVQRRVLYCAGGGNVICPTDVLFVTSLAAGSNVALPPGQKSLICIHLHDVHSNLCPTSDKCTGTFYSFII